MIGRISSKRYRGGRGGGAKGCLTTQHAFPRSAIFTLSLSAFRGSSGLRTKSEALNPETHTHTHTLYISQGWGWGLFVQVVTSLLDSWAARVRVRCVHQNVIVRNVCSE